MQTSLSCTGAYIHETEFDDMETFFFTVLKSLFGEQEKTFL